MANPTTYFGWVMPTSTDLVTDLPADFNVFGQGVDTSMQDLLGGTTGQVLSKTSATNMDFTWVTPAGGKVLQVKNFTIFNLLSSATSTWVTTNLALSITPSLASSKILIIVQHCGCGKTTSADTFVELKLRRDTTDLLVFEDRGGYTQTTATNIIGTVGTTYLDSPATTSAISYNTQFRSGGNLPTVYVGYGGAAHSTITLMEIGA